MTRDEFIAIAKSLPNNVWNAEGVDEDMLAELGEGWMKHLENPDFSALLKIRNERRDNHNA